MELQDLYTVKEELKRFSEKLEIAIKRGKDNKGYKSVISGEMIGVGSIMGTKESGAVKRAGLDLKRILTDKLR